MDELALTKKLKLWQNRLLDLSKRNKMISLKESGMQVMQFIDPGFEELYRDLVIRGKSMTIKKPLDKTADAAAYAVMRLMRHLSAPVNAGRGDILPAGTLETGLRRAQTIKRYADLSLQEKGTNILYLAFGVIYWRDKDTRGAWIKAPLVLVPAKLTLEAFASPYGIQKTEEDIQVNPTFSYYLEMNHHIKLPKLKDPGKIESLNAFMEETAGLIQQMGWRVEKEVYLSTMSFMKTNMYNDLVENEKKILAHPIIRSFGGEQNKYNTLPESSTAFHHDQTDVEQIYEVLNADSSQKDAVELSRMGISFVMQGPPGTGKSQTITNIIAQGIAEGKKILFVSEKQAALDVVYHRLEDVGLAELCLPLHDPKTNKLTVLQQLEHNLDEAVKEINNDVIAELHQLDGLKEKLNRYSDDLHKTIEPLNLSVYEAYELLFALSGVPDVNLERTDILELTRMDMNRMIRELNDYESVRETLGNEWYYSPWSGIKNQNLSIAKKTELKEAMTDLLNVLDPLCSIPIVEGRYLGDLLSIAECEKYENTAKSIAAMSAVPVQMVLNNTKWDPDKLPEELLKKRELLSDLYSVRENALLKNANRLRKASLSIAGSLETFCNEFSAYPQIPAGLSAEKLYQLAEIMYSYDIDPYHPGITEAYFTEGTDTEFEKIQSRAEEFRKDLDHIRNTICKRYTEDILQADLHIEGADLDELEKYAEKNPRASGISLKSFLKNEFGIYTKADISEKQLEAVTENILKGSYERYAALPDAEFYFVYEMLETANEKEQENEQEWFEAFGGVLEDRFGKDCLTVKGIWEKYLAEANDFYYIRNTWPELLQIAELDRLALNRIESYLLGNEEYDRKLGDLSSIMKPYRKTDTAADMKVILEDARAVLSYQEKAKQMEGSYLHDTEILGDKYRIGSTDWAQIAGRKEFVQTLGKAFNTREFELLRPLLLKDDAVNWSAVIDILRKLIAEGRHIPGINTYTIVTAAKKMSNGLKDLHDLEDKVLEWEEICGNANRIIELVHTKNGMSVKKEALESMMEPDGRKLFDILDQFSMLRQHSSSLESFLDRFANPAVLTQMPLSKLKERVTRCLERFDDYDRIAEFMICYSRCRESGLNGFITKAYTMRTDQHSLGQIFEKSFLTAWLDRLSDKMPSLSEFSARVQKERIGMFGKLDKKQLLIDRDRVRSTAIGRMPKRNAGKVVGEMGILLKEIGKSRNAMTIRQLFSKIPNLLMTLKPCLMMSPMSVAYFLAEDKYKFEMVIFDEASQILPENAIGAILRGKQAIIAGDSKQMPPTSFFQTAVGGDDEDADEEESVPTSDSILEEAENVLPNLSLTWHYRSRCEELITFSNRYMYSNSLVTFPNNSAYKADHGVEFEYVENGVFTDRTNLPEAQRCLELAIDSFKRYPERSVGIIAFSISQEEAIERVFFRFRTRHPEYEGFFDTTRKEPFFIKNLENVQGDERDLIILSVGYGKNAQGILRYNFGPLGMSGGERRLNVAVTRAKYNIKLVSSLRLEDFDREKVEQYAGAKLLYDYISYALQGNAAAGRKKNTHTDDGFKRYICSVLDKAGYNAVLDVGQSGYKVEIAVEDPGHPGTYIAGLETDGRSYHQARTVRDRECLRPDMLRVMGWNMYRIWSTQWIRDPVNEEKKLLEFIQSKLNGSAERAEGNDSTDTDQRISEQDIADADQSIS